MVAPEARVLLELKGRDALLVTGEKEDTQEPRAKRDAGSMKDRSRCD